ncbi:MAG: hypothetical protein RJS97_00050, partial [Parvibaculaceae bacterium]
RSPSGNSLVSKRPVMALIPSDYTPNVGAMPQNITRCASEPILHADPHDRPLHCLGEDVYSKRDREEIGCPDVTQRLGPAAAEIEDPVPADEMQTPSSAGVPRSRAAPM